MGMGMGVGVGCIREEEEGFCTLGVRVGASSLNWKGTDDFAFFVLLFCLEEEKEKRDSSSSSSSSKEAAKPKGCGK